MVRLRENQVKVFLRDAPYAQESQNCKEKRPLAVRTVR